MSSDVCILIHIDLQSQGKSEIVLHKNPQMAASSVERLLQVAVRKLNQ